jgi:hypothetical protein
MDGVRELLAEGLDFGGEEVGDVPQEAHGGEGDVHEGRLPPELADRHDHLLHALCSHK